MSLADTIVAIATPAGRGAIGIVRVSGPQVPVIAKTLCAGLPTPRNASLRTIIDSDGQPIDESIVLYFPAPASFTGEDILEIQTHGGAIITAQVYRAITNLGGRAASPGEFSERAFVNGKIDLIQAEAIADLIDSSSEHAARLAQKSLSGEFSKSVTKISDSLKALRVTLEALIDFPEDDLPAQLIKQIDTRATQAKEAVTDLLEQSARGAKLNQGIDIVILGRPNVGKSTLLNALAREDRAIVTNVPGTTRDILSVDVNINNMAVRFHDTAGLRDSDEPVEREGMRRAYEKTQSADAVLLLHTNETDQVTELDFPPTVPRLRIRNKIDLENLQPSAHRSNKDWELKISARNKLGIDLIRDAIVATFGYSGDVDNTILARERHIQALSAAAMHLDIDVADLLSYAPELLAEQLRLACEELAKLTGEYTSEDLLGEIFSTFCIGK